MNIDEANRCLLCKNARCQAACPINTDIPKVISLYKEGKYLEAQEILFENNPFSSVCSLVCDWDSQCKGNCIRGIKGDPIEFHKIEEELSLDYLEKLHFEKPELNGKTIAVVGGGPAGLTVAIILARKGYYVTLFDEAPRIGGVLRYGIPDFRLDKSIVDKYEVLLKELGVVVRPNTLIGTVITLDKLVEDGYDAIFVGTGAGKPKELNIKGESLGHIHYAIDYLRSPETFDFKEKVIVIGGGNVAMDAARTAKRQGKDVTVYYRKTFENMPANKPEIEEAIAEGVKFEMFKAPKEFTFDGAIFEDTENYVDENGKVQTKIIEGSKTLVKCDAVIIAVSQTTKKNLVSTSNIELNKWGLLVTDSKGQTSMTGIFGSGDVVSGAKTVVNAIATAKQIAKNMDLYCQGLLQNE
ncbi:MAG: NAD(P)-dependent oxidoreductase [Erysipelotrichaceae bacterium]|nr:NAD(P)-dependent oxidoreductase [Erysipelotrichaceae bacterium]